MKLEWTAPPAEAFKRTTGPGFYGELAAELKKRPGTWALVPREFTSKGSAQSAAGNIRRGVLTAMPKGEFEAIAHENKVWARYLDPEDRTDDGSDQPNGQGYAARVRAWAKLNKIEVSVHGRLPADVIRRYEAATGESAPEGSGE